jgi:cytochrome c peroxidase
MAFRPFGWLWLASLIGIAVGGLWLSWPAGEQPSLSVSEPVVPPERSNEALVPLPPVPDLPADKVALGRLLFLDPRLSHDNTIACASCHDLDRGGNDGRRFSVGVGGAVGAVNAPTVLNASLNFVQFWDGRAASLEEQAAGPVHNPMEMASNWDEVVAKLRADANYRREFRRLYPEGIAPASIVDAIATFERTLTTDSPFDRFLRGDSQAIDAKAREGYRRFKELGCASCHQGVNIGGNMFQRFGVMGDYFADRAGRQPAGSADLGRFNVTGREEDRHVFKVPSLRNVALTAPYFHDGSAPDLDHAVLIMARYQLGRELSNDDVRAIVAFLRTLTGEPPRRPGPR